MRATVLALLLVTATAAAAAAIGVGVLHGVSAPEHEGGVGEGAPEIGTLQRVADAALDAAAGYGAPMLEKWIVSCRDAALQAGVEAMPQALKQHFAGFFPKSVLDRVHYRVGWPRETTFLCPVLRVPGNKAVTLREVVVFENADIAEDPVIWAHELTHVQQYDRWGVAGFAARYARNPRQVEGQAWDMTGYYKAWAMRNWGESSTLTERGRSSNR